VLVALDRFALGRAVLIAVLCIITSVALAAPRRAPMTSADPDVQEAERLWKLAEAEPDRNKRAELWEDTSAAYAKVVAANAVTKAELAAAANAALLALRNAFHVDTRFLAPSINLAKVEAPPTPQQLPARQQRVLWVIETVGKVDATSKESIGARFFAGVTRHRFDHLDEAIAIFIEIIDNHPRHELAEAAVSLALDTYNRQGKRDAMLALVERLRADKPFLTGRADLAKRLDRISFEVRRAALELMEKKARETRDYSQIDTCGEQYLAIVDVAGNEADEMLSRASSCFAWAGSAHRALAAARTLLMSYPKSKLVAQTHGFIGLLEARIGNFEAAATAWEKAWQAYDVHAPARYESMVSAENALYHRVALADWARADKLLARIVKEFPPTDRREVEFSIMHAVQAALQSGKRAEARRWLLKLPAEPENPRLEDLLAVLLDVSCPVAPVDGLCPARRDAKLLAWARRYVAYIDAGHASVLGLDLELEDLLAKKVRASTFAALATKLTAFTDAAQDPPLRVIAHARLARIARETKDAAAQRTHLEACISEARAALVEQPTLVYCERELAALKVPVAALREHLPLAVPILITSEPPL
jgi:tetratricopeptide (TPR) repeat protein